jgi:hypothetical protein
MHVTADNYEEVVTDLDQRFHMVTQKKRIEAAASVPVEAVRKPSKVAKKPIKTPKKAASKKPIGKTKRKK